MNPFKIKAIDDFTIEDCETYLNSYPFGDHSIEVKNRLKGLKKGTIKISAQKTEPQEAVKNGVAQIVGAVQQELIEQGQKENSYTCAQSYKSNKKNMPAATKKESEEKSTLDTILWWIGAIVIVLIVGTIIIYLLSIVLPEGTLRWVQTHRWIIYGICSLSCIWKQFVD